MLFNSGKFLVFFPIVVVLYYCLPNKVKNGWLLVASYYFYMCWNAKYAILLLTSTIVTYVGGLAIAKAKTMVKVKKVILILAIAINLSFLFYYKYINFAMELLDQIFSCFRIELNVPSFDIILPVGISFYIFKH